ncbi:hypothetical protein AHAS_Ahas19G0284200 [Arachis hypogaea]
MFVILMRKFASTRMVQKAIEVLDEMPNYKCEPDEYVFGCLLDALCKNGSIKETASHFEDIRYRFPPTIKHFTSLLYGDEKDRLWTKCNLVQNFDLWVLQVKKVGGGYELLDRMIQQGLVPNQLTYHHLMLAHKKKKELEEYMELMNEMHKRSRKIEACEHFKEMVDKGIFTIPQYEITKRVRKMAADQKINFKMYKRRGERDLKEKAKEKKDGKKRRARQRHWGGSRQKSNTL